MEFTDEQQQHIYNLIKETKDKWVTEELTPIQNQVKELEQYKPVDKTEQELALEAKEKELFTKEKNLILKEKGLQDFADFFVVSDLKELNKQIEKLNKILEAKKLNNSYVPDGHKPTDAYTQAKKNNDPLGMVKALFNK
ncbi:hypothetical protein SDC9_15176 [bioreactor metagenome]|uniref:Uncharacterized protein n=1 Tax=bioreactor metagenome TaxID=1076179 RepID=A0A644TR42_9ZZZZ|nr:hypothetical protein [Desulfitobacterium hafniense]MEA5023928.1 hypothetical protein [Desulfitobacterium hafniense]